ncbi:MAG TPA: hypothetical protein VGF94_09925 [Kofleriaceae bacterium]|jgi:hypothetical protein
MRRSFVLLCTLAALAACPSKKASIAELTKAVGPVERAGASTDGKDSWAAAAVGTKFFIGDAARTADGTAELELAHAARIEMQPHTVLRFGGDNSKAKLQVDLGEIALSGAGKYAFGIGDVTVGDGGTIRIAATGGGKDSIQLVVGTAQISDGTSSEALQIGQLITGFGVGPVVVETVHDAGVDAAPPDAAAAPTSDDAQIDELVGKGAEILPPGEKKWQKLAPDQKTLAKGTQVRLDGRTTLRLIANGTTLQLSGGAHMKVGDDLLFGLQLGVGTASVPASTTGKVGVPGGEVDLAAPATGPAKARIDVSPRGEAKVAIEQGTGSLTGATGIKLAMARGETAAMPKDGSIHPGVVIPTYFDFRVPVGELASFTIHDPKGATAVQFSFAGKCPEGGVIEMDKDARFATPRVSAGKESANMMVTLGGWAWRLRCETSAGAGRTVALGHILELHDSGTRILPKAPARFPIDANGLNYKLDYQSSIPDLRIKDVGSTGRGTLHLASGGTEQTFESTTGTYDVSSKELKEGEYTFWIEHDGGKSKVTSLKIGFDQTAAQVYIQSPINGQPWGDQIDVRGATLPGWTAKIDVLEIPLDKKMRFSAQVAPPAAGNALAIRLSHPKLGIHFYIRRGNK